MNQHAMERLELPLVLDGLARFAETETGQNQLRQMRPVPDLQWLRERHAWFSEAQLSPAVKAITLTGAIDLSPLLERAQKGGLLYPVDLWPLAVTIERGEHMQAALNEESTPTLARQWGSFNPPRWLRQAIAAVLADDLSIRDTASPRLLEIRRQIRALETEIDQVFQRLLRSPSWSEALQDALITVRNGRRVVPVKHTFRHKVAGLVHDQSGSGQTVFIEPMAVVERQNQIMGLQREEEEEIERILRQLTGQVVQAGEALKALSLGVIGLDVVLAQVRWAERFQAGLPRIGGDTLVLDSARHPLLTQAVPLSLDCGGKHPGLVITGPNTGGKTVALKCAGLMVLLALTGCPVPAGTNTQVPLYHEVLADIGDEQSLEQSLSTFSGHLSQLIPMVKAAGPGVLLLVDEVGAGTDPEEGAALAMALLERLLDQGAAVIATTHYRRVKMMAYEDARIQNAQVEFDRENLRPTYRLIMGQPGSSQALYVAARLGLDEDVLERARALQNTEALNIDEAIRQLNQLEQRLRGEEQELARARTSVAQEMARLESERKAWEAVRDRERERYREDWRRTVLELRNRAEMAIADVKEAEREDRDRALETLRTEMRSWARGLSPAPSTGSARVSDLGPIKVGSFVEGPRLPEPGRVSQIDGEMALVEVGPLRLRLALGELSPARREPAPQASRSARIEAPEVRLELDLRGLTVLEAVDALDQYLDKAYWARVPSVRIIHGKGTGALRRAVQEVLSTHPQVSRFRLGEIGEGGDGVTVVHFDTAR